MIGKAGLSKIGIGAWGLGGLAERNPENDDNKQIDAVCHSLQKGVNFLEINFWNSQGHSVEILRQAIKKSGVPHENLFLIQSIYNYNLETIKDIESEFHLALEKFETKQMDSLQFNLPSFKKFGFDNLVRLIERYLTENKIRYTSLTNSNLEHLKRCHKIFKDRLFSHELCFNFEVRVNEDLGISRYADGKNILNVPYQPLRRNRTAQRNWPLLVELAGKYGKSQNQIILNWIVSKGYLPLVKSENINHINENVSALEFKMEKEDLDRLNAFRVPSYKIPDIDWYLEGKGTKIHILPNEFDSLYPIN